MIIKPCEKLIRDLDLSPGEAYTQDWVWKVSDFRRIETFLQYYRETILNFEEKRALINIYYSTFPADISKQLLYKCGLRVHPIGHFTFYAGCDIR